ncbi:hypothetical protein N665_2634s0001 [Sinapis alba]|nr:hypothetical protein N665_2634s0001 [Sinapis alba]
MKIYVLQFDNSELIEGYATTLIGRCMNPSQQDMKGLLIMLPKIWKVEDRVVGIDLGLERFPIQFSNKRNTSLSYKFWVRVLGVPLPFWAAPAFECIGKALGKVLEINLDEDEVHTLVVFHRGEENMVSLCNERLFGYCRLCSKHCHNQNHCPSRIDLLEEKRDDIDAFAERRYDMTLI